MAGPGEQGGKSPEVERLEQELAAAKAEASRYKGAHQQAKAREAEAQRKAKLRQAGQLTEEEKAALDRFGDVDPTGRAAMDAMRASQERRELAMLEAGGGEDTGTAEGFDDAVDRAMDGPGWRDTIKSNEYARWFESQPQHVKDLGHSNDPAAAVRVLTMYESSRKGGGDTRSVDPRLEGARNAPGSRGLVIGQTRDLGGSGEHTEGDEDDYMWGWNEAGKQFEDRYKALSPHNNADRYSGLRGGGAPV